jgi:hypothetical protein
MRIDKSRGNRKTPGTNPGENDLDPRHPRGFALDIDLIEQLVCSDCGLVYGEMLALDGHHGKDKICPRCGAGDGAVSSIDCLYHAAQASLMRF